jgi:Xaa-Pro aminopeptidase
MLDKIRKKMTEYGIDVYIITKNDPHQTEYGHDMWNGVRFACGFTGTSGNVVVTQGAAGLWTDGRYYVQAEKELGEGFTLFRTGEPGVPDFIKYVTDRTEGTIGFDPRTVSYTQYAKLQSANRTMISAYDIIGELWTDRPIMEQPVLFEHELRFCGRTKEQKLVDVRKKMDTHKADYYFISNLDDIAWLYNKRTRSILFPSYCVVTKDSDVLFVNETYDKAGDYLQNIPTGTRLLVNLSKTNAAIYKRMEHCTVVDIETDITTELKAIKNETEIVNLKNAQIRDGVAMVRFIIWLKENVGTGRITEYDAAKKMDALRSECENYICPAFDTIAAYGANAAMAHYKALPDYCDVLKPEGLFLIDSGGNYLDGTTDITRTIALGELTDQMKTDFTLVLKGHIALANAKFLHGTTGTHLDILARQAMWVRGVDYKHGTGHGIGYCLNVHEGPQRISQATGSSAILPGMLTSNEPAIYRNGEYGIRTENAILAVECKETEFGIFYGFETVTYCPIDLNAVDFSMLDDSETVWLEEYHMKVYEVLSPFLSEGEREWMKRGMRTTTSN